MAHIMVDGMNAKRQRITIAKEQGFVPRIEGYMVHSDVQKTSCMSGTQRECLEWMKSLPKDSPYSKGDWEIVPRYTDPPDYPNDLNAMHEAEGQLISTQARKYHEELQKINFRSSENAWLWFCDASQRAEAFLRTIGKWK